MKIARKELIEIIKEEVEKFQLENLAAKMGEESEYFLEKGIANSNRLAYYQEKRADEHATYADHAEGDPERQQREGEMAVDFYTGAYDEFKRQFLIGRRLMRDSKKSIDRINKKVDRLEEIVAGSKMSFEIRENIED